MDRCHTNSDHSGNEIISNIAASFDQFQLRPPLPPSNHHHPFHHQVPCGASNAAPKPNIVVQIPIHSAEHHQHGRHNQSHAGSATRHHHHSAQQRPGNEIKSEEPIKSELDPAQSAAATAAIAKPATKPTATVQTLQSVDTSTLVTARPKNTAAAAAAAAAAASVANTAPAAIRCLRCASCPFISITQAALDQHVRDRHQANGQTQPVVVRKKLPCPGCDNVFYSRMSLEAHLLNDHQMSAADIALVLESVPPEPPAEVTPPATKQKIYLKNVEILRNPVYNVSTAESAATTNNASNNLPCTESNPNDMFSIHSVMHVHDAVAASAGCNNQTDGHYFPMLAHNYQSVGGGGNSGEDMCVIDDYQEPIDPDDFVDLIDDEYDEAECTEDVMQPTIFVKNDMLLKNPITYYQQSFDVDPQTIDLIETPPPQPDILAISGGATNEYHTPNENTMLYANDYNMSRTYHNADPHSNAQSWSSSSTPSSVVPTEPRRPGKIFIKNVDILKQPMFVQSMPATSAATGSLSMSPQPTFLPSYAISLNGRAEFPTNILSTSPRLLENNAHHKQIFIKNIDILKEPTVFRTPLQTHGLMSSVTRPTTTLTPASLATLMAPVEPKPVRRNALHLRTVEELNLNTETINKESESRLTTLNLRSEENQPPSNAGEQRRTLHLRTVDELNLMNINEVQNLIENFQEEPIVPSSVVQQPSSIPIIEVEQPEPMKPVDMFAGPEMHDSDADFSNAFQCAAPSSREPLESMLQDQQNRNYTPGEDLDKYVTMAMQPEHFEAQMQTAINDNQSCASSMHGDVAIIESNTSSLDEKASKTEPASTSANSLTRTTVTPTAAATWSSNHWNCDNASDHQSFQEALHADAEQSSAPNESDHPSSVTINLSDNSILEYAKDFDENILFVCAQEIIGSEEEAASATATTADNTEPVFRLPLAVNKEVIDCEMESDVPETPLEPTVRKGRIYVVNNLMKVPSSEEPMKDAVTVNEPVIDVPMLPTTSETTTTVDEVPLPKVTNKTARKVKKAIGVRPKGRRKIVKESGQTSTAIKTADSVSSQPIRHRCTHAHCVMQFGTATLVAYHERCHTADGRLTCPDCPDSAAPYRTWNTLHTHLWRQHQIDMELYSCEQCNFKTPIRSRLTNTHMRIHSDERNFKCDQCDKAFKNTKQLKNHRRTHLDAVPGTVYRCRHCDRCFYNQRHLRNHERSLHEGGVEFRCDVCSAVCSSLSSKRTHMLNHASTEPKVHRCADCAYESNDYNSFRRHRRTHGGSEQPLPYQCPFCAYGSIQSTTYARHVQREHPDEAPDLVFACIQCKFLTVNRRKYDLHVLNHDAGKKSTTAESADNSPSKVSDATTVLNSSTDTAHSSPLAGESGTPAVGVSASGKRIKVRTGLTEAIEGGEAI